MKTPTPFGKNDKNYGRGTRRVEESDVRDNADRPYIATPRLMVHGPQRWVRIVMAAKFADFMRGIEDEARAEGPEAVAT